MDGLTPMQRRFCLEYLKDKNGTKAAIRAGYAKKGAYQESWRLLKNAEIRQYIRTAIADQESRIMVDADRVKKELSRIAFFDASICQKITEGELKLEDLTADERAAIGEFQRIETEFMKGDEPVIKTQIKIKPHSKIKALEILAKHFQLFEEPPDTEPEEYERPASMRE